VPGCPRARGARARDPDQQQGTGEGWTAEQLRTDVLAGAPPRDRLRRAFEAATGQPALFSHRRWGQRLDRALARADRYAHHGRGERGAGAAFLVDLIFADAEGAGVRPAPSGPASTYPAGPAGRGSVRSPSGAGSLAFYVPIIDAVSKDWRRAGKRNRAARRRRRDPLGGSNG
jgi:hypothetical protein